MDKSVYEIVTDRTIEQLETGVKSGACMLPIPSGKT